MFCLPTCKTFLTSSFFESEFGILPFKAFLSILLLCELLQSLHSVSRLYLAIITSIDSWDGTTVSWKKFVSLKDRISWNKEVFFMSIWILFILFVLAHLDLICAYVWKDVVRLATHLMLNCFCYSFYELIGESDR
jgi:hypothetical protein